MMVRLYLGGPHGMDLAPMHRVYEDLSGDRLAFVYSGCFPDEHTSGLITLGEEIAAMGGVEKGVRNRLAFVLVEAYQNIVRHRASIPAELGRGSGRCLFVVTDTIHQQQVVAVDPVSESEVAALKEQLEHLFAQGPAQLKELFLGRLRSEQRSVRGGAGLGLIEMARRSGNPLEFAFTPLDEGHRMFMLKARLGKAAESTIDPLKVNVLHDHVVEQDLIVLCKGPLTTAIQELVLHMMEKEVQHDEGRVDTMAKAYLAANVLLQSRGGWESAPMISLGRKNGYHVLVLGVRLIREEADRLERDLGKITEMSPSVIQRHYRDALLGRGDVTPCMLSLLDLARNATEKIQWEVHPTDGQDLVLIEVPT